MKLAGHLLLVLSLFGCSPARPNKDGVVQAQGCPGAIYPPYHSVTVHTTIPVPAKLAVTLEGVLKFDQCLQPPEILPAPVVRASQSVDAVTVVVGHWGGYASLPTEMSFEILDRGDCTAAPISFYRADRIPLNFIVDYPNGKACGGNTSAKVDLSM